MVASLPADGGERASNVNVAVADRESLDVAIRVGVPRGGIARGGIQRCQVVATLSADGREESSGVDDAPAYCHRDDITKLVGVGVPGRGIASGSLQRRKIVSTLPADGGETSSHVDGVPADRECVHIAV